MAHEAVEVTVGKQTYRLVASADRDTLHRLAELVDEKLEQLDSRHPQALLLAALALANDVLELRRQNSRLSAQTRRMLESLLTRVDSALDHKDENGEPLNSPSPR